MGASDDPTAVLDPELKVKGIEALRVIDASMMPKIIGANTNATVMAVAWKAIDMIFGKALPEDATTGNSIDAPARSAAVA